MGLPFALIVALIQLVGAPAEALHGAGAKAPQITTIAAGRAHMLPARSDAQVWAPHPSY